MTTEVFLSDVPDPETTDQTLSDLADSIAEGLAHLSEAMHSPQGVTTPATSFSRDEVDLYADGWIYRLADVQDWLNFGVTLPTSREDFLQTLVAELGFVEPEALHVKSGTAKRLSTEVFESLNQRVETAVRLQQRFQDAIDSGVRLTEATENWLNAWDEAEPEVEPASTIPVTAKAAVWPIYQFTRRKLNLTPSYQRGDVWRTSDRQALIESILRGIPLPSLILLRTKGNTTHEVVDGKQRLTAILRFVGAHPVALARVKKADASHPEHNLMGLFKSDYPKFRRVWKMVEKEDLTTPREDEYYFPFKLRSNDSGGLSGEYLAPLQGKYYTQIKHLKVKVAAQELDVEELFEGTPDYDIPVIEYIDATQRQIHEVFKLYNKQGVHLNAEEIRNAVFHELALVPAILFAAGDADPRIRAAEIAPFLEGVEGLNELGPTLRSYGFGDSRYKRTKVLSWLISTLLHDTYDAREDKRKPLASTAKHIDHFLERVRDDTRHALRDEEKLRDLFTWIAASAELHAGHEELWAPSFMDGSEGAKWQELQLVGSLVGIALALAASPEDLEERLDANAHAIYLTSELQWKRMEKTQTKTQWDYIRRIVMGLLDLLDIDPVAASNAVRGRFGSSGLESLQVMKFPPELS